jgi:hypothetical protein
MRDFFTVVFAEGSPLMPWSEAVSVSRLIPSGFVIELPWFDWWCRKLEESLIKVGLPHHFFGDACVEPLLKKFRN